MSSQLDLSGGCDVYGPVRSVESRLCNEAAEARTVTDGAGDQVQVGLCDHHFAYVSAPAHAHHWFVDRAAKGPRAFIRLAGRQD
jgi:hypothetical protein